MDYRKVEIHKNNLWQEIDFHNLKKNDYFRMFESTGESVKDKKGNTTFLATSDVFLNDENQWVINVIG